MNLLKKLLMPLLLLLIVFACSEESPKDQQIIAKINDYELSLSTFQKLLTAEYEMDTDLKLTQSAQKRFLEELIRKELLIQEAKRLDLDKQESFASAIERYWETTLIRSLMQLKSKDIVAKTFVSEEEIEARYNNLKSAKGMTLSYPEAKEQIQQSILEEKKSMQLKQWIDNLQHKASIQINEQLLGTGN